MPRPAPVMIATRPSNRKSFSFSAPAACGAGPLGPRSLRAGIPGSLPARSSCVSQQLGECSADHGGALVVRHTHKLFGEQLAAPAERALRVRIVVAPHNAGHAREVTARDGNGIVLERDMELSL